MVSRPAAGALVVAKEPSDVEALVKQLLDGASPEEGRALLDGLLSGAVSSIFEKLGTDQAPIIRPAPADVRGFRVRLDLLGTSIQPEGDETIAGQIGLLRGVGQGWTRWRLCESR